MPKAIGYWSAKKKGSEGKEGDVREYVFKYACIREENRGLRSQ